MDIERIERADDLIQEYFRRCAAHFGDAFPLQCTPEDVTWLEGQANAWPYGEPNLFRTFARHAEQYVADGSVGVLLQAERAELLKEAFRLSDAEIEEWDALIGPVRAYAAVSARQ
jgi:hypothetical protein